VASPNGGGMAGPVRMALDGPYDLSLSLRAAGSFAPGTAAPAEVFRAAVALGAIAGMVEVRQPSLRPPVLEVSGSPSEALPRLQVAASRMLFAGLDLRPFYRLVEGHPVLGAVAGRLFGLKPMRPASLFEMLVIAVVEQQISLMAAYRIRKRLVERFGEPVDDLVAFPQPDTLAEAPPEEIRACGLSGRKTEYVQGLAQTVVAGALDLGALEDLPDDAVRAAITRMRGFGPWSAEYLLVRGMARVDVVPADDLGVRTVTGRYLAPGGVRLSPEDVRRALAPFAPYRGLAAFYLLAEARLGVGT
jgi:DNA-3-methyladenine glycosylase II